MRTHQPQGRDRSVKRRVEAWGVVRVLALFLLMVSGLSIVATAASLPEKVVFRLNWIPEGEGDHAMFYVALDKGYYREVGLDVEIQRGSGSGDTVNRVAAGTVDVGYADTPSILAGIGQGAPLHIVGMVYQTTPLTLWTRRDTGIRSIRDLAGRTVGAPAGDAHRIFFPALAQANGLDPDSVRWVSMAPGAKIQSLAAGRIDATFYFLDGLPLFHQALGKENTVYFHWAKYGVNPYGNAFFVREETLRTRRDMVARFLDATYRGLQQTILNPDEAVRIVAKYVPAAQPALLEEMLNAVLDIMYSEDVRLHGLGWIDLQRMKYTVDLVQQYISLARRIDPAAIYTNDLLRRYDWPLDSKVQTTGGREARAAREP